MALPGSEHFPKRMRLHSRLDFDDLFHRGLVIADQVLVVHGRVSPSGRLGISIAKRVGHAPLRNYWKRLIREAYRRQVVKSPDLRQIDVVVRPRKGAKASYAAVERSLASLTKRMSRQLVNHQRG